MGPASANLHTSLRQAARTQYNSKSSAVRRYWGSPNLTVMTLDDLPANRQTQSHAVRLRRHGCLEHIGQSLWIDPRPVVQHLDDNGIAIPNICSHFQHFVAALRLRYCINCVGKKFIIELWDFVSLAGE